MLKQVKEKLHIQFPWTIAFYEYIRHIGNRNKSMEEIFGSIYHQNGWNNLESNSGIGSTVESTRLLREALPLLIKEYNITSIIDAPCGDYHWMSKTLLNSIRYVGLDIVPEIIEKNKKRYNDEYHHFDVCDITKEKIPKGDLILCRDVFIHLTNTDIVRALYNICTSGSTYLLTTSFSEITENHDGITGGWRPINLRRPPFNFGIPLTVISEESNDAYAKPFGKYLGLWLIKDIHI